MRRRTTTIRAQDSLIPRRMKTNTTTSMRIQTMSTVTVTAITPDEFPLDARKQNGRPIRRPFYFQIASRSDDDDPCAEIDAAVQIDHVLIAHPNAAGGDVGPDRPGFVGTVDTIERRSQIHRAGAERVLRATLHVPRQIGTARQHFGWRRPRRPFLLRRNLLDA